VSTPSPYRSLSEVTARCGSAVDPDDLLASLAPALLELGAPGGLQALHVVRRQGEGLAAVAACGTPLEPGPGLADLADVGPGTPQPAPVPEQWRTAGVAAVTASRLPSGHDWLVLAWDRSADGGAPPPAGPELEVALALVTQALGRLHAEGRFADLSQRVDNAQQLANMGDYDWHISTDTNRWSDQLYRIYGHEPQSFNASYERFLSHIHPDDRERIMGIHQRAYASGEPYQMIERIVRPDGEVRYLSSNGQVVMDEHHQPVRMRGTCVDITDRVLAEQAREQTTARFQALVEASPDAILVLDADARILQANGRATELLGGDPVGHRVEELCSRAALEDGRGVPAIGLDARPLRLDTTTAALDRLGDEGLRAVFLHDATARLASEALAASLREAQVRRRQAMEINDNVVQGLTAATYALEQGDGEATSAYLRRTLSAARRMMNDLLDPLNGEDLQPGDLVRAAPTSLDPGPAPSPGGGAPSRRERGGCRVLVVDDSEDVRLLLRLKLQSLGEFEIVGEAADGEEAVRKAATLKPDLVLLDLAMPRMDGLEALPLILAEAEGVSVIVLSGFDQNTMADKALAAGAARYVEKGVAMSDLARVIEEVIRS
jgi:PAS domain S-box-containing protein